MCRSCGLPSDPDRRRVLAGLGLGALGLAGGGAVGEALLGTPAASAGQLPGPRLKALKAAAAQRRARDARLARAVSASAQDLDGTSQDVGAAVQEVQEVAAELADARTGLAAAQRELAAARVEDRRLTGALATARGRLSAAQAALTTTRAEVAGHQEAVGAIARRAYVDGPTNGLLGLLGSGPDTDLLGGQHAVGSVLAGQSRLLTDLATLRQHQQADDLRLAGVEQAAARSREASAQAVARVDRLTRAAADREGVLAELLDRRRASLAGLRQAQALDAAQYHEVLAERQRNQAMLRSLARRESAAERAAAARARRERAAAGRGSAGRGSAGGTSPAAGRGTVGASWQDGTPAGAPAGTGSGAHRVAYPCVAEITSPFGMRFHPILHIWKLHDGTDFGVGVGTPLHMAAPGTVLSTYFNVAYGNRVIVDNGILDGMPVATSYNHLSQTLVRPGQRLEVGDVVALSGATGWVTGPHLHFMVYESGTPVDSMTWL